MGGASGPMTARFFRPFTLPGFDEVLPAGEYGMEAELPAPTTHPRPESCRASDLVHLHPRISHPTCGGL